MTSTPVEAWAVPISWFADHTFVAQGDTQIDYFACWGQKFYASPKPSIVTGNINYSRANCYRDPLFGCPDTAGIGIYGVNGVCHQSANCFLFSANVTLNFSVAGYWASVLAYGPYGTLFIPWLLGTYAVCSWLNPFSGTEAQTGAGSAPTVGDKIRALYASYLTQPNPPPHPHDRIITEAAIVTKHHVPEADPTKYQDLHAEFLKEKDTVVTTGITGQPLADQLNNLSKQLQGAIAQRVGAPLYQKLNGVDASQTLGIIDPSLAAIVGRPVPPSS